MWRCHLKIVKMLYCAGVIIRPAIFFSGRGLLLCIYVYVCHFAKYLWNFEMINFFFGGGLPSDPEGVGWGVGALQKKSPRGYGWVWEVWNFGPNNKRYEKVFQVPIITKRWEVDMWFLLDTIRKSYMGSPTAPLYLTLNNLERLNPWSLRFWSLISEKGL